MAASYKCLVEVPSKLEIQCKKAIYFSFNFGWHSIQLDIVHLGTGLWGVGSGGLLNGQKLFVEGYMLKKSTFFQFFLTFSHTFIKKGNLGCLTNI